MKSAKEYFKATYHRNPRTDADKMMVAMMRNYADYCLDERRTSAEQALSLAAVIKSICDHPWKSCESVMGEGMLCRKCNTVVKKTVL